MLDHKLRLAASVVLFVAAAAVFVIVCISLFVYAPSPEKSAGLSAPPLELPVQVLEAAVEELSNHAVTDAGARAHLGVGLEQPLQELSSNFPSEPRFQTISRSYTVRRGDTLNVIATRNGKTAAELVRLNRIKNINRLEVGQVLQLGTVTVELRAPFTYPGPSELLVPDSDVIYGPAYKNFSVRAIAEQHSGYLLKHRELVEGQWMTGPEIVQLVAERYSVGPRVLLSLLDLKSGWVTQPSVTAAQLQYPVGYLQPGLEGLFNQLSWAAQRINAAYYLSYQNELDTITLFDGDRIRLARGLNPGTIAVQNVISRAGTWATFTQDVTSGDFAFTYSSLFGEAPTAEGDVIIPEELTQPALRLPWQDEHLWWYTGGPHNGWAPGSDWAAVDFAPSSKRGSCRTSLDWAVAAAPGLVVQAENGRVVLDLDGDGFQGTGWSLLYMHIAAQDRIAIGTRVKTGDRIGHPSCEGGYSTGAHLHFARLYNGQWIPAADARVPLNLAGWTFHSSDVHYDGTATHNRDHREASSERDETLNGIRAKPTLLADARIGKPIEITNVASMAP